MKQFKKLAAIEPVSLVPWGEEELKNYAEEIVMYPDIPKDNEEILKRIGDADAVLLSYTSRLDREVLEKAPNVKYVGMCCSLYSEESANVDIAFARTRGITVTGIRDYGDRGVVEYVLYQLVKILHGYEYPMWKEEPVEITGLKVGIVGLGVSGGMIADALHFMGAEVSYFARSPKPEREAAGICYKPLHQLLADSEVIFTCLNKNVILLHKEEFACMGNGKIMFNTSIGPAADMDALKEWLANPANLFCCDTRGAIGPIAEEVLGQKNVLCVDASAGRTRQAFGLLSRKVLDNIKGYLDR
ncbi:MAG: NAD(P)-dependent oxidoreductase [Lachnospiraceae bacterium]|nr:NAD(P)-dependent oxidoreductase [Lachnospiraceae bacterium]